MADLQKRLSVTIAFVLTAAGVLIVVWTGVEVGLLSRWVPSDEDWIVQGFELLGFAALAGLMVDAIRLLAALVWQKKPRYRLKLSKILRQNLA